MRRLIARAIAKLREPKVQRAIQLAGITFGATCAKNLFEEIYGRLDDLEERGLVPLDDLVTVRDVSKLDRRVWVLEGEPGPDPALAFEVPTGEEPAAGDVPEEAAAPELE